MATASYLLLLFITAAALGIALGPVVQAWRRTRGKRLVTCPETQEPAVVEIDAVDAAFNTLLGFPERHLRTCTRWPQRAACDQACQAQIQIEKSPAPQA